jgi:hypothetical protein
LIVLNRFGELLHPVAAPDDNDIEMNCESVKRVDVDLINKPILWQAKRILCQYSGLTPFSSSFSIITYCYKSCEKYGFN